MGRYTYTEKSTVEESRLVNIAFLNKHNYFRGWQSGTITWSRNGEKIASIGITVVTNDDNPYIKFNYNITSRDTGKKTVYEYQFPLVTTPCNFGGKRYWFECGLYHNGKYCGRKVSTLYQAPGSKYFGCRHCMNLNYETNLIGGANDWYYSGKMFEYDRKADEIYKNMTVHFYNGAPTRKYRRYMNLRRKSSRSFELSKYFRQL